MSRLDLVIFGATGFTGKKAVENITKIAKKHGNMTWGVAGRNQSKLEDLLADVGKKTGEDLSSIRVIVADVTDEPSLKAMCQQATVIVNCCGPYRLYGEPVVKAAIDSKANYVDVSGEPQFIETMQLKYNKAAEEAGVYIVSACGLDSVPNDVGVVYLQQNFDGTLNSVESYLSSDIPPEVRKKATTGVIHYGTWESLVHSLAHWGELSTIRKQLYAERLPPFTPKLMSRGVLHRRGGGWCLPFMGADGSIVYRTQRYLYEAHKQRPVQFKPYIKFPNIFYAVGTIIGAAILYVMCMTSFTRKLLLDHPRFFSFGLVSREGPSEEVMESTSFSVDLFGAGWPHGADVDTPPSKKMAVKVSGMNPGYGATTIMLLMCAVTILREGPKMPSTGGVVTTGAAFYNTDLVKSLNENDVKFQVVENK